MPSKPQNGIIIGKGDPKSVDYVTLLSSSSTPSSSSSSASASAMSADNEENVNSLNSLSITDSGKADTETAGKTVVATQEAPVAPARPAFVLDEDF
jgi:hypothetical protein